MSHDRTFLVRLIIPAVWLSGKPFKTFVGHHRVKFSGDWQNERYADYQIRAAVSLDGFPSGELLEFDTVIPFAKFQELEDDVLDVEIPPVVVNPLSAVLTA
jgi:hypothetical protein